MMSMMKVPYVSIPLDNKPFLIEFTSALEQVVNHGNLILGPEVTQLENQLSDLIGIPHVVAVSNGTSALYLTLLTLNLKPGDEVITVPNSYLASTSSIVLAGGTPVFCDINDDLNIRPESIIECITPNTKAILPVHLTGRPCQMDFILDIAKAYNLSVIEDCAQAIGSYFDSRHVGGFGICGCFSLHPLKNFGALGDGGFITTHSPALAQQLRVLRNHGHTSRDTCVQWSHNMRLDTLQAAFLLIKLPYLQSNIEIRRSNAKLYKQLLSDCPHIVLPPNDYPYSSSSFHTFVIKADLRLSLAMHLQQHGIETKIHYPTGIPDLQAASTLTTNRSKLINHYVSSHQILSLPIHHHLSSSQIEYTCQHIRSFYSATRN
jgi:dTDP-4-amino-4,6-dideoxygalactose transaminase